jgi:5'-methylthioadenosine phosphorylase
MTNSTPAIGVIGGSGLYELPGLTVLAEHQIETPFGAPSEVLTEGELAGRKVFFLPRHGRGHRIAPHEINHRANIYALRSVGVRWLICVTAVGSLREEIHPREVLIPDQLFDRTSRRPEHTFFGHGIVAHVSFADPFSASLRRLLVDTARSLHHPVHDGGTYVNMDGPAFSTRAESEANRHLGFHIIGMTNLGEAKLAREAEIACATLALITDYDCWKTDEEPVSAAVVGSHLAANVATAKDILANVIPQIPTEPDWPEHHALDGAIQTPPAFWPAETRAKISLLLSRFVVD